MGSIKKHRANFIEQSYESSTFHVEKLMILFNQYSFTPLYFNNVCGLATIVEIYDNSTETFILN